jgi:hypothetical protein
VDVVDGSSDTTEQQTQRRPDMQATTTTRRFDPRQIKQAALAIAILTSAAIGVTTASIVRDAGDSDSGRTVVASAPAAREQTFGYQFMEQNLNLPSGEIAPATAPAIDYRFLEMNLDLPGSVTGVAPDWRMIEQNSWGEDFVLGGSTSGLIPPSVPDSPQQLSSESPY